MTKATREPTKVPRKSMAAHESDDSRALGGTEARASVNTSGTSAVSETCPPAHDEASPLTGADAKVQPSRKVARGLTTKMSTKQLKDGIWLRALLAANRFRVIRTIDVAVCCFAERPFKAALTASQRATRGLVKADLLRRYRTDRFQHILGLSSRGVDWLDEAGYEAASSVRRVSDMTNPEHRLWAQFWVLCCEARGLTALTEQELLQELNRDLKPGAKPIQGLLTVSIAVGDRTSALQLRPDAICREDGGAATTWAEIDRSKRGSAREASLAALCSSVGRALKDGSTLRRVVVFCKTERIRKRAIAVLQRLANANNAEVLAAGRRHFREVEPGVYEVWAAPESRLKDGRTRLVDTLQGHVIVQLLPTWLPRVRIDAKNMFSMAGWFGENYLPYSRPESLGPWGSPVSPLLSPLKVAGAR